MVASATTMGISNNDSMASYWLILWLVHNVGLTLLNKMAFSMVHFPYPFLLSAVHMLCNWVGSFCCFWMLERHELFHSKQSPRHSSNDDEEEQLLLDTDHQKKEAYEVEPDMNEKHHWLARILGHGIVRRKTLDAAAYRSILGFSIIFSLNIAVGNVSLKYVSVNFNQIMRSLVPALTIAMSYALGKPVSRKRRHAVIPIILGVAMACYGDISYTAVGFFITLLCIILAALKVVASGEILTGQMKLHPVDLLAHMAPLAMVQCLLLSLLTGEAHSAATGWSNDLLPMLVVGMSGILSFSLNICSLQANKLTSPLTMCIAGNVKQILMLVLATIIFSTPITSWNGAGIVIVLVASANYSYISMKEKQLHPSENLTPRSMSASN